MRELSARIPQGVQVVVAGLLLWTVWSCSGDDPGDEPVCEAGETRDCDCAGGGEGTQSCLAGAGWSVCRNCTAGCTDSDGDGYFVEDRCEGPVDCDDGDEEIYPTAIEVCDGVDNDCQGGIDEDFPDEGADCTIDGEVGRCAMGELDCRSGREICQPTWTRAEEIRCNELDDDCDGETDEFERFVDPDTGIVPDEDCFVAGQLGPCINGERACQDGAQTCVQTVFPGTETCNEVDDDCNGEVDDVEGDPCS